MKMNFVNVAINLQIQVLSICFFVIKFHNKVNRRLLLQMLIYLTFSQLESPTNPHFGVAPGLRIAVPVEEHSYWGHPIDDPETMKILWVSWIIRKETALQSFSAKQIFYKYIYIYIHMYIYIYVYTF